MSGFMEGAMARWQRLESYLDRLESHSSARLAADELDEFVLLYRLACADLARVRRDSPGQDVETYLNEIVARGHKQFRPPSHPPLRRLLLFIAVEFPREVRALGVHLLVACLLFFVPMGVVGLYVYANPAAAYSLAPPSALESLADAYAQGHAAGRSESEDSLMAGYYINNNVGIAFQCFATGVFFGLGSVLALLFNGIVIGAIGGFICGSGHAGHFLSFVSGHGAFELTAIALCGAAGIRMGMLLVNPGRWTRATALLLQSPSILMVVLGAAAMLVAAAFIEGFWSPSSAPALVKYIVAAVLWTGVIAWLGLAGRRGEQR